MPNLFHVGARPGLVHAKHISAVPIEESRNPIVRDAMDVHWHVHQLLHDGAELIKILVGRVLKIDRDMDVRHSETADARCLVWQSLLMAVKPEIDDMPDTERVEILDLRFGRLTRRSDPIVEATPALGGFRVGHERSSYEGRAVNCPARFRSGCLQNTKLLKRGHAIGPEHDLSGKPHLQFNQLVSVPNGETHDKSEVWGQTDGRRFEGNQ